MMIVHFEFISTLRVKILMAIYFILPLRPPPPLRLLLLPQLLHHHPLHLIHLHPHHQGLPPPPQGLPLPQPLHLRHSLRSLSFFSFNSSAEGASAATSFLTSAPM